MPYTDEQLQKIESDAVEFKANGGKVFLKKNDKSGKEYVPTYWGTCDWPELGLKHCYSVSTRDHCGLVPCSVFLEQYEPKTKQ